MQLTKRFRIKPTDELTRLCRANNDLYNQALYHWRQHYEQCGGFMSFYQLESEMRGVKNLEGECNFRLSKERYAHFTVKLVKQDIDSFFAMMKRWKAHPEKFKAKPEFPHFKRHGGMIGIQCDTKGFTIKDGYMMYGFGKEKAIPVPQWEHWRVAFERATLVRFIPQTDYFIMEVVYESEPRMADVTPDRVAAIDLGIDNLATMVAPDGCVIYSGKPLKAYNQLFNKQLARANSILHSQEPERKYPSKRIRLMYDRRERYLETYMHTVSRRIVDELTRQRVGLLVVGKNKWWKLDVTLGRKGNQRFSFIPFNKLLNQLRYKCEMAGIGYVEQEEGHTSKCDALALESIGHHEAYMGCRRHRGLFVSSTGKALNADQNGALNILRKYLGDNEYRRLTAGWQLACSPRVVSVCVS